MLKNPFFLRTNSVGVNEYIKCVNVIYSYMVNSTVSSVKFLALQFYPLLLIPFESLKVWWLNSFRYGCKHIGFSVFSQ